MGVIASNQVTRAEGDLLRANLVQFRERTGLSMLDVSRATGLSYPGVHYVASGRRPQPQRDTFNNLSGFMRDYLRSHPEREQIDRNQLGHAMNETETAARCAAPDNFLMTAAAQKVTNALNYCARRHLNGALFGDPGVGKTAAMRHWSATTQTTHAVIFCRAYTTYSKLLRAIATAVGVSGQQTSDLDDLVHEQLSAHPLMLVVDEADMLGARTLDWLRSLWDESNRRSHFVLLAKPAFYRRLQTEHGRSKQDLRQVWRRINFKAFVTGISRDEMLAYLGKVGLGDKLEPEAIEPLHIATGGSFGDLDMLVEIIEQILSESPKAGGKITVRMVEKARDVRFGTGMVRRHA